MNTVIRWNPMREMAAVQSAFDRIFEDAWRTSRGGMAHKILALDVRENDEAYNIVTTLPGVSADQVEVSLQDNVLTISAEVQQAETTEGTRVLLQERAYGRFSRSINLPQEVDADKVEAAYENGVLTLTLPKLPEAQPRMIPVKNNTLLQSSN